MEQSLNTHERFEELCALVACGEASQSELAELTGHLRSCAECRGLLNDCAQAATQVLSQESGEVGPVEAPPGMTERFVARARAEGIPIKLPGDVTEALSSSEGSGRRTRIMFWAVPILAIVLAALFLKLITAASRSRTQQQSSQSVPTRTIPSEGAISTVESGKGAHTPGDPGPAEELRVARARIAQLEATLSVDHRNHESVDVAKAQTVKLEEELANLRSEGETRGKAALLQEGELAELRTSVMRLTAELDERK